MNSAFEETIVNKNSERQRRVLCIDDDAINRMVIKHLLEPLNFAIDMASSGNQALELMKNQTYDIVLLDILMPGMNGFETAGAIRKSGNLELPIVFISAGIHDELAEEMANHQVKHFLAKPVNKDNLFKVIAELI